MESLAVLQDVMREYYLGAVDEVFNHETTIYGDLTKSPKGIQGGKSVVGPLWIAYNERGVGSRAENEALPIPGANEYDQFSAAIKYNYGVFDMTGQAMKMTKGPNTLIDESKKVMQGLTDAMIWDTERQFWGNGDGWIGEISVVATNKLTWIGDAGHFLKRGMYIDTFAQNGTKHADSAKILNVDYANHTIDVDAAGTAAVGDWICREDCTTWSGSAFVYRDMTGLKNLIGTGDLEGITVALNTWWKSIIHDNSGAMRDIDEMAIMAFLDEIVSVSGELPTALYTDLGGRRAFKAMLNATNQSNEVIPTRSGFNKGMKYSYDGKDIPVIGSRHVWSNSLVALNFDHIWLAEAAKRDWDNLGGGIIKPKELTDAYYGRMSWYANLVIDHRCAVGAMTYINAG